MLEYCVEGPEWTDVHYVQRCPRLEDLRSVGVEGLTKKTVRQGSR